jgi:hypothetical protein
MLLCCRPYWSSRAGIPDLQMTLYNASNIQVLGLGFAPQPSLWYYGLTLGATASPPAVLIPTDSSYFSSPAFTEDHTVTAATGNATQGGPGWRVPANGLYEITASANVTGTIDYLNFGGATAGSLGVNSPFTASIQYALNNSGFPFNTIALEQRSWTGDDTGVQGFVNETTIATNVFGKTLVRITTADVLFVAVVTSNANGAMSLGNSYFNLKYIAP